MITWEDTFGIIKQMFNVNQNGIANLMNVSKCVVTKIKKGRLSPSYTSENMYHNIFDPNTPKSPANDNERFLLSTLEEIIEGEFRKVKEAMKDCWVNEDKYKIGDYEKFVMKMLERTVYISSSKGKTVLPDINNTIVSNIDSGGAQLSIPDKYRKCVFCIKWKGNASDAYKIKTGVYGTCMMYNRDELSTGGADCKDYEPNYARVNNQMLLHK